MINVDYPGGSGETFGYDKLGNCTSTVNGSTIEYETNNLNQYTLIDGEAFYTYDDNGNLLTDRTRAYTYDCENRLTSVVNVVTYKYDYLGRLVKTIHDSQTTSHCYDGDQIIAEYDGSGNLVRKFVYGAGIDEPVIMINVDGQNETKYYYHFDGTGSVVALSNVNGEVVEKYSYDVYGEPDRTSDINNPYFFTGRQYDETGNYYYRARYYKPSIGRFLQTDPIGYTASLNLYTYVYNNPSNNIDPDGLWTTRIHNYLIDHAFPNLTSGQRQILKNASADVDSLYPGQLSRNAYQHAMSMSGENPNVAAMKWSKFLADQQAAAQRDSDFNQALYDFGRGLHALADSTSPSHRDFQPWELRHLLAHHDAEKSIGIDDYLYTIKLMRQYYKTTFGEKTCK